MMYNMTTDNPYSKKRISVHNLSLNLTKKVIQRQFSTNIKELNLEEQIIPIEIPDPKQVQNSLHSVKDKLRDCLQKPSTPLIVKYLHNCTKMEQVYDPVKRDNVHVDSFRLRNHGVNLQMNIAPMFDYIRKDKNFTQYIKNKIDIFDSTIKTNKRRYSHTYSKKDLSINFNYLAGGEFRQLKTEEIERRLHQYKQQNDKMSKYDIRISSVNMKIKNNQIHVTNSNLDFEKSNKQLNTKEFDFLNQSDQTKKITGNQKSKDYDIEGQIKLQPKSLNKGSISINLKVPIQEEIYKFNCKVGEKITSEQETFSKFKLHIADKDRLNINNKVIQNIKEIFEFMYPNELYNQLMIIQFDWKKLEVFWQHNKKIIQVGNGIDNKYQIFAAKKLTNDKGTFDESFIEGLQEYTNDAINIQFEITQKNRICEVKISIKQIHQLKLSNLIQFTRRNCLKLNQSQQDMFLMKNSNGLDAEMENVKSTTTKETSVSPDKKNLHKQSSRFMIRKLNKKSKFTFGIMGLDLKSEAFKSAMFKILTIAEVYRLIKNNKSIDMPTGIPLQELIQTKEQADNFAEYIDLQKQCKNQISEVFIQFKQTQIKQLNKFKENNPHQQFNNMIHFIYKINNEVKQLFDYFIQNKNILLEPKLLTEMKKVYRNFVLKTIFASLFNIVETDGIRQILPFVHQDDCQENFRHKVTVGNLYNKIKKGGKFNQTTFYGKMKHKNQMFNRQFSSDYKEAGRIVRDNNKDQIRDNRSQISNISNNNVRKMTMDNDMSKSWRGNSNSKTQGNYDSSDRFDNNQLLDNSNDHQNISNKKEKNLVEKEGINKNTNKQSINDKHLKSNLINNLSNESKSIFNYYPQNIQNVNILVKRCKSRDSTRSSNNLSNIRPMTTNSLESINEPKGIELFQVDNKPIISKNDNDNDRKNEDNQINILNKKNEQRDKNLQQGMLDNMDQQFKSMIVDKFNTNSAKSGNQLNLEAKTLLKRIKSDSKIKLRKNLEQY